MAQSVDLKLKSSADTGGIDQFEQSLEKLEKQARETEGASSKLGGAMKDVFLGSFASGGLQGALSNVLNDVKAMATEAITLADNLADLSGKAGVSASAIQRIGNAAADNGSSLNETADVLARITIQAEKAKDGNEKLEAAFKKVGISASELKGLAPDEIFLRMADSMKYAEDKGAAFADVAAIAGNKVRNLRSTLELGAEGIETLSASFGIFSDETVARLDVAKQKLEQFRASATIAAGEGVGALIEQLEELGKTDSAAVLELLSKSLKNVEVDAKKTDSGILDLIKTVAAFGNPVTAGAMATEMLSGAFLELSGNAKGAGDSLEKTGDQAGKAGAGIQKVVEVSDEAVEKFEQLEEAFHGRYLDNLPLEKKLAALGQEIKRVRDEASKEIPEIKFGNAEDLNFLAAAMTKSGQISEETGVQIADLASELAGLEDASKKAQSAIDLEREKEKADLTRKTAEATKEAAAAAKERAAALKEEAAQLKEGIDAELEKVKADIKSLGSLDSFDRGTLANRQREYELTQRQAELESMANAAGQILGPDKSKLTLDEQFKQFQANQQLAPSIPVPAPETPLTTAGHGKGVESRGGAADVEIPAEEITAAADAINAKLDELGKAIETMGESIAAETGKVVEAVGEVTGALPDQFSVISKAIESMGDTVATSVESLAASIKTVTDDLVRRVAILESRNKK